jgi:hypothetical protein
MNRTNSLWLGGLAALLVFMLPLPAFAQGCALCYTQAAASGSRMIHALRDGILILVLPPTLMSVGVAFVAYRRRDHFHEADGVDSGLSTDIHNDY